MGADFIFATTPACELTEDRREILGKIIEGLTDDDCPDFVADIEEWRGRLTDALDAINGNRRDVSLWDARGIDYRMFITGGMSWGDEPTQACTAFGDIDECESLYKQLEEWAKEDDTASKPKAEPTRQDEYIASGGSHCPYCKSARIIADDGQFDGSTVSQDVTCCECNREWQDVFVLSYIFEPPEERQASDES